MSIRVTLIPPDGEKMERIFDTGNILVGRSSKCDLTLDTESLSRKHCLIEFDEGQFYITDLSSTNGVYVEGRRIRPESRERINIFLPLQISIFDCMIQEVEITAIRNPPILKKDNLTLLTTPTKKINSVALNQPLKMLPKDKNKDLNNIIKFGGSAALFVGILLYALLGVETDAPIQEGTEEKITQVAPKKNIIPKVITSEDIFLSPYIYMQLHEGRQCENKIYCENLFLILEEGEGISKENNDQIIYLKPTKHLSTERYSKLKEEDADIIAFDLIMNSRIMEDFLLGKIAQIHLGIVNQQNKVERVYRFHPSKFNFRTVNRQVLNPLMESSILNNKAKEFWDVILSPVQKLDLPQ